MTDAPDYDAIEARANAATEGPWLTDAGVEGDGWVFVGNRSDGREFGLWEIVHSSSDPLRDLTPEAARRELADAAFIAHARTDVPALIARCRELEAKVAAAEELFKEQDRQHAWNHYGELSDVRCDCCGLRHAERQDYSCCESHTHGHEWSDREIVEALVCGDDCPPWSPFHERTKTFPFSDYDASPIPGDPTP